MPQRKGLVAPQNTFLDTIATRFDGTHSNFVLGNAQVREHPIVYCSDGLVELTGFNRSQIISRCCSCSFLWGNKTTEEAKEKIMDALENKKELQIEVYFYKNTGDTFLCLLDIVPIKNDKSQVVLFLVSHKDITSRRHKKKVRSTETTKRMVTNFKVTPPIFPTPISKHTSFLSAGLATTITAAALGTSTTFRKNKLLDYISANKLQVPEDPLARRPSPNIISLHRHSTIIPVIPGEKLLTGERFRSVSCTNGPITSNRQSNGSHGVKFGMDLNQSEQQTPLRRMDTNMANETLYFSDPDGLDDEKSDEEELTDSSDKKYDDYEPSTAYKYDRRRSRAVLFHLSGKFDPNTKRKNHLKKFQTIPEYKVQDVQASRFILLHYSILKIIWDWLILVCTFYIAVMVPYNAATADRERSSFLPCDIIVELLLIIDIFLNFVTTFVSKSGQIVYRLRAIALHYVRGWFVLDLIAAIPIDLILEIRRLFSNGTDPMNNQLHLLKLARLLRLARLFQKIERYSQFSTLILGLLMCMFFLIAHWFACGWYWLGKHELNENTTHEYSWLYELSKRMRTKPILNETGGLSEKVTYISSLYFTTTSLTSVGFGNVSPNTVNEKIFSIIAMLIGALMHAAVFGNVTTLIQRMYARRSAYQTKNQDLKDFTRAHHIPKALRQRMLEFFQAMWAINQGIDKEAIMQSFPENVRGDIALHLNREVLSLSIFKSASPGCLKGLAQIIDTRFATPGELLINQGDILRHIHFVCSGSLEILDSQGTVVGLLGKCDIFGSDIDSSPKLGFSAYDVKSLTYCELQCIPVDHPFQQILQQYPSFRDDFAEALHKELSFNIREGYDPSYSSEVLPAITLKQESNLASGQLYEERSSSSTSSPRQYPNSAICEKLNNTDEGINISTAILEENVDFLTQSPTSAPFQFGIENELLEKLDGTHQIMNLTIDDDMKMSYCVESQKVTNSQTSSGLYDGQLREGADYGYGESQFVQGTNTELPENVPQACQCGRLIDGCLTTNTEELQIHAPQTISNPMMLLLKQMQDELFKLRKDVHDLTDSVWSMREQIRDGCSQSDFGLKCSNTVSHVNVKQKGPFHTRSIQVERCDSLQSRTSIQSPSPVLKQQFTFPKTGSNPPDRNSCSKSSGETRVVKFQLPSRTDSIESSKLLTNPRMNLDKI